jgi:hypothetical protein
MGVDYADQTHDWGIEAALLRPVLTPPSFSALHINKNPGLVLIKVPSTLDHIHKFM